MTLGHYPESLVIGYLRNQGFVAELADIESVQVDWDTNSAAVKSINNLNDFENKLTHRVVTSGCGQGTTFGGIWDDLKGKNLQTKKDLQDGQNEKPGPLREKKQRSVYYKVTDCVPLKLTRHVGLCNQIGRIFREYLPKLSQVPIEEFNLCVDVCFGNKFVFHSNL